MGIVLKYPSCAGWHDASSSGWFGAASHGSIRGDEGIFSFSRSTWTGNLGCGRGVAVIGTGL